MSNKTQFHSPTTKNSMKDLKDLLITNKNYTQRYLFQILFQDDYHN